VHCGGDSTSSVELRSTSLRRRGDNEARTEGRSTGMTDRLARPRPVRNNLSMRSGMPGDAPAGAPDRAPPTAREHQMLRKEE